LEPLIRSLGMQRLTAPQLAMLKRLAVREEWTPTGTRTSGREAANWHATLRVLVRLGLATKDCPGGSGHRARLTELGRRHPSLTPSVY
jgi:hypothetical protein